MFCGVKLAVGCPPGKKNAWTEGKRAPSHAKRRKKILKDWPKFSREEFGVPSPYSHEMRPKKIDKSQKTTKAVKD